MVGWDGMGWVGLDWTGSCLGPVVLHWVSLECVDGSGCVQLHHILLQIAFIWLVVILMCV